MRVDRVMTRQVATVSPETPLKDAAELLTRHGVSGMPVCDADGAVIGVFSEADVLRKVEGAPRELPGFLRRLLRRVDPDLARIAARTVGEAMTAPAVTVRPTQQVAEAAQIMVERRINRLPVVRRGELVGIVGRADVLRSFERPDAELEREITEEVLRDALWLEPETFDVHVERGVVSLTGKVSSPAAAATIVRLVRRVPGVVDVSADLANV